MGQRLRSLLLAIAGLLLAAPASAQLVTENAGTTSPETPAARLELHASRWQFVEEFTAAAEFHYGFHPRIEGNISIPLLYRSFEIGGETERLAGLGDVRVGGKFSLSKTDGVMSSVRTALFGGIELPTGRSREGAPGGPGRLPRKLQLGSGTFDLDLGFAFTYIHDRHRFAIDLAGRASTRHAGVRPGAEARVDAAYWFRVLPAAFEPGAAGLELRAVLDASFVYRWRTRGEEDDSGGRAWLSPGLQFYATPWLLLEGNVQLPVYDGVDDSYGRARIAGFVAVKILF